MDKNKLYNLKQTMETTLNILNSFDQKNEKVGFRLKCLLEMLNQVESYGDFYPVSDVYSKVATSVGTNKFVIRGIFVKLCQAGLLKRESLTIPLAVDINVTIDAFCLTTNVVNLFALGGEDVKK